MGPTSTSKNGKPRHLKNGGARYVGKGRKSRLPQKSFSLMGWLKNSGPAVFRRLFRLCAISVVSILGLGLVSTVLIGGYLYLSKSDYFAVRKVSIAGLNQITREEVLAAVGLDEPANVLTFDLDAAEAELNNLPWLASVRMTRSMPDAINIEVVEYKARLLVNLGRLYYMDDQGLPFKMLEPGENPDLPIVSGFTQDDLLTKGPATQAAINEVLWLVDTLAARNDEFKLVNISEVNYDPARGLTVFTKSSGIQIKIGFGAYDEKFRRLGRVMAHLKLQGQNEGLRYLNLESSPRVTVRYDNGAGNPHQRGI